MKKLSNNWSVFSKVLKLGFLVSLCLCLLLLTQLKNLNTQYSVDQFLPDKHPLLEAKNQLQQDYAVSENSPILVLVKYPDQTWLEKTKMKQLKQLSQDLSEVTDVDSVQSLATIESVADEESEIAMGGLFEMTDPKTWQSRVVSDPTLYPLLISKNFDTAVIAIMTSKPRSELLVLLQDIRNKVAEKFPQAEIQMGGVPTIQAQMSQLISDELKLFLLLALIVACFSLLLVFSSLTSILTPIVAVVVSLLLSLEFMVIAQLSFNALSATVMVLVTIIVVALCIHTQLRYAKECRDLGDRVGALAKTFTSLFLPNFLTALTTAVGFLTLYTSPSILMRQYGISVTVAVMIAWLVTSFFLFGFLNLLPVPKAREWVFKKTDVFSFSVEKRKRVMVAILIFIALCLFLSRDISWQARLFDDLPKNHESRKVSERIDKHLGGLLTFDVAINAEEEGYWNEPEALKKIDLLQKKWRQKEYVESVISVPELIRQSKNDPTMDIPNQRSQIAEIGFMFSLAEKNPLIHFLTPDASGLRISMRLQDVPAQIVEKTTVEIVTDLKNQFPDLKIRKGGMASYAHSLSEYLSKQLMIGFWWAMLAISIVLLVVFRSLTWTIIATLPNFLPAIALLGLLGFTKMPIKPAIATIFSIALGIAFDNTVYILSRLKSYKSPLGQKLVKKAIQEEGISCFISSFCLFCGFAIFLMSYFSINRYFGVFLLFSILVGLVGDLMFLPAILGSLPEALKKRLKI